MIVDFSSGRIEEIAQAGAQAGFYLLAWGMGRIVRAQEERRAAAERHVVRVELEREEQARAAVVEERARIARELHDAVAHSVSVMVLQAGGVRRLLGSDPAREREREALAGVEETGRQAVGELHRMLGILRKADPGAGARAVAVAAPRRRARRRRCAPPGWTRRSTSKASPPSSPRAWTCPPTGSCRRR